jgi:protein-arginine deiminase
MRAISLLVAVLWGSISFGQDIVLDGDADRSGAVDGSPVERGLKATKSVIVINNCDRDEPTLPAGTPQPDNFDRVINGDEDRKDLEPIIIRRTSTIPLENVSLRLSAHSSDAVDEKRRVRIFKSDGTAIIGPESSTTYELSKGEISALQAGNMSLLVEGLNFATSVKLSLYAGTAERDSLIIEVAPFILVPHSQRPAKNYVVRTISALRAASTAYVKLFTDACAAANVQSTVLESNDVWIEDEMSWGYSETPRIYMPIALHLYRLRDLKANVRNLLASNVGLATIFDYGPDPINGSVSDSINYGGNLEVTPPTQQFPFGRVYYGSIKSTDDELNAYRQREIDPRYQEFFKRSKLQPPIDLNTDWLGVGHVDEVVTFVPRPDGKFALLLASPKLALDVARRLRRGTPLDSKYNLLVPGLETVDDLFSYGQLMRSFEEYNMDVDFKTFGVDHSSPAPDSIKGKLKAALNLDEGDIFEVPVLYYNHDQTNVWFGLALSPGMVNLNSMGRFSLVPDPFLNEFKHELERVLGTAGQVAVWIDDWFVYHAALGEVHCGSNTLRVPFAKKWWQD